jgi:CRP/FNR family cyclic AMP-dependent transcriptional regulator
MTQEAAAREAGQALLRQRLDRFGLLQGLSPRQAKALLRSGVEIEHPIGKRVLLQGSDGIGVHLILEGQAVATRDGHQVGERLGPGSFFGEMAIIDGHPRSASVTVVAPLRTMSWPAWEFLPLLDQYPVIARALLIVLCRRVRAAESSTGTR